MNSNTPFDEQARRKLDELDFPFSEEDWKGMHALIQARDRKRKRRFLFVLVLVGSTLAPVAWWSLGQDGREVSTTTTRTGPTAPGNTAVSDPSVGSTTGPVATPTKDLPNSTTPHDTSLPAGSPRERATNTTEQPTTKQADRPRQGTDAARPQPWKVAGTKEPTGTRSNTPDLPVGSIIDPKGDPTERDPNLSGPTDIKAIGTEAHDTDPTMPPTPEPVKPTAPLVVPPDSASGLAIVANMIPSDSGATTTEKVVPTVQDSAAPGIIPPALRPDRAPWEITGLFGWQSSRVSYTGPAAEMWGSHVTPADALTGGVELVHMGRRFGWGGGVHYATYSERIDRPELDRTDLTFSQRWILVPVDTTIFLVTDTLPPGNVYEGHQEEVTVHVLDQTTDTTSVTTRVQNGLRARNRVSYVEIPLLADLHWTQGRWTIGARGGPGVGLLTSRRGQLPEEADRVSRDLQDERFRSLVWSYQARAYVRYRFNAAWSIGVEPGIRGHFGQVMDTPDLVRRNSAWFVMGSLSYRLR